MSHHEMHTVHAMPRHPGPDTILDPDRFESANLPTRFATPRILIRHQRVKLRTPLPDSEPMNTAGSW